MSQYECADEALPEPQPCAARAFEACTAQALVVLGGEDRRRLPRSRAALAAYQDLCLRGAEPPLLILSGGTPVTHGQRRTTEAMVMSAFLRRNGVAEKHILIETHARNTLGNVVFGGDLAARRGLHRIALVTDDFHHWRSRQIYLRVFGMEPWSLLSTGGHGSLRARTRERLSWWWLAHALARAGVPAGDLEAHKRFLLARQSRGPELDAHWC